MSRPGPPCSPRAHVLVIKLGALGDVIQALGAFAAIRRHHAGAAVTLLTTPAFADFLRASPYFDRVWAADRPGLGHVAAWWALRRGLRAGAFARVYDLQTSDRSSFYFRLFWPGPYPEWSGIARGCSHPHRNPERDRMHTLDRLAEQLAQAGIEDVPDPDLSWVEADAGRFPLAPRYALLVAGGAPHRPAKRWPLARYAALARWRAGRAIQPVLVGGPGEREALAAVSGGCPETVNLAGETSLFDIVGLARGAALAVGNDTGPMHLIAAAGCPSVVLYSDDSDPALCGQRGRDVVIVRSESLDRLGLDEVSARLRPEAAAP